MSTTWFIIKSLLTTFAIISVLQVPIGKKAQTLEIYFISWMKRLSASRQITDVARGGQALTQDFAKEFITQDGHRVIIGGTGDGKRSVSSDGKIQLNSNLFGRLMKGFKLDLNDLNEKAKEAVRDQVKKELEAQMKKS